MNRIWQLKISLMETQSLLKIIVCVPTSVRILQSRECRRSKKLGRAPLKVLFIFVDSKANETNAGEMVDAVERELAFLSMCHVSTVLVVYSALKRLSGNSDFPQIQNLHFFCIYIKN